ncbi:MAG: CAP domain-containing protein, partial [Leuconostoc mesenteroides]
VSTGSTTADATINAWNAKRAELGLSPVTISASLTSQAQSRAQSIGTSSNWFSTHMSSGTAEVVANGFGAGSSVINAWYYETGMVNGGHTAFIVNPNFTQAGVGYYNGWIVINAQ